MSKVTLDTNIYISALNFGGLPAAVLDLVRTGSVTLALSDPIVAEVERVLSAKFEWNAAVIAAAIGVSRRSRCMSHPWSD